MWAAYAQNSLGELNEHFPEDMGPDEFNRAFAAFLENDIHAWVMNADTPRGRIPVGMVLGRPWMYGMLVMGYFTWFPWASKRNVYESLVNIVNGLRYEANLLFHVDEKDKALAIRVTRHGIVRRVGTLHYISDEPIAVFQSRNAQ